MTSEERQLKKQLRQQRLIVLAKQEDLEEKHCQVCTIEGDTNAKCRGCEIHTQLRQLGEQLTAIANSKPRKEIKIAPVMKEETKLVKEISLAKYQDLKAKGIKEKDIADKLGVSTATLWNWKKKNGLLPTAKKDEVLKVKDKPHDGQIDKLKNKIAVLQSELQELEMLNNEITKENKALKLKSDTQEAHLEAFSNTNRELQHENASLLIEISKLRDQLDSTSPNDSQLKRLKQISRLLMEEMLEVQQ